MAERVMADWRAAGRDVRMTRDLAEHLASEVGNRLAGYTGGSGAAALFGASIPDREDHYEPGGFAESPRELQKKQGIR